jgi:hypothetical protein
LTAAQRRAAEARSRAQQAADSLIINPSRDKQLQRDRLNGHVELVELEIARIQRRLEAARQAEREAQVVELRGQVGELQARAQQAWQQVLKGLELAEGGFGDLIGIRSQLKKRNHEINYRGVASDARLNIRPSNEVRKRLAKLAELYDATIPLG